MSRRTLPVLLLAATLAGCLVGCGGPDRLSESAFHAKLDAECAGSRAFNEKLPQRQRDEGLTSAQTAQLAEDHSRASIARVRRLVPPENLVRPTKRLLALMSKALATPPRTTDAALNYLDDLAGAYDAVGAPGCTKGARESADQFRQGLPSA